MTKYFAHAVVLDRMAAPIPATLAYENAAALPLALSTAACGLDDLADLGRRIERASS